MSMFTAPLQAFAKASILATRTEIETARSQVYGGIEFRQSDAFIVSGRGPLGHIRSYACELYGFPKEAVNEFVVKSVTSADSAETVVSMDLEQYIAHIDENQSRLDLMNLLKVDSGKCFALYCVPHPDGGWGYLKFAETPEGISFSMTIYTK